MDWKIVIDLNDLAALLPEQTEGTVVCEVLAGVVAYYMAAGLVVRWLSPPSLWRSHEHKANAILGWLFSPLLIVGFVVFWTIWTALVVCSLGLVIAGKKKLPFDNISSKKKSPFDNISTFGDI